MQPSASHNAAAPGAASPGALPDAAAPPAAFSVAPPAATTPPAKADRPLPLFARADFRAVAGETLRPGGLALTQRALTLADLPPASLLADLGCGPGATARLLSQAGHRVLAVDITPELPAGAAGPNVWPVRALAQALPLAEACLDAVFCECVLSATGQASAVLAEAARVLKPGGVLVVSDLYLRGDKILRGETTRQDQNSPAQDADGSCLSGALPQNALLHALCRAGLAVQRFEDHSRLLAELAARLVFAGIPRAELGACAKTGGGRNPQACGSARAGYFLCLARKLAQ